MAIEPELMDYCATDAQRAALAAINEHEGNLQAASLALGKCPSYAWSVLNRVKKAAALKGYAPGHFTGGTAPGYAMGKVTVERDKSGAVVRTWERQSPEAEHLAEMLNAAAEAMAGGIEPATPITAPSATLADLLTLYTFTDFHLGALCWHREGGADWDLAIAERDGAAAMRALVDSSPASEVAVLNVQGDFLHTDGLSAITPTNGHLLDADGRFGKIVGVAIRLIRQLLALALEKHGRVILLICEGNHDLASSIWLRKLFGALYEAEPRISVHDSELPYYALQHGEVLLGFHHGHLKKNEALPALFAAQFRRLWGECSKVAIHTGHRHHREVKEHPGAEVVQHPTLAARDAYAARGGWFAERRLMAITYHKRFGEVATATVTPEMLI